MKVALTAGGLYDDEAEAMLKTWESAYFRKAGLRLFYIVPRAWIDAYVPLELTRRADVTRVYIGRIDLQR
jgi:hypothetical protein